MRKNQRRANLGYAFVHFTDIAAATSFTSFFNGYRFQGSASTKVGEVKVAHNQGFFPMSPTEESDDQEPNMHTGVVS